MLKNGVRTAIVGLPNAGKSSLLNALAGYDRAIVTDIPGTTRDTVEETVTCGGTLLRLIDTAGIHDTADAVEQLGVERSRKASLTALVDRMEATAIDPAGQTVFISHGDCLEDAEFVAGEVRRRLGVETVHINYVGPVIGNHSGPGTMALFFLGSER